MTLCSSLVSSFHLASGWFLGSQKGEVRNKKWKQGLWRVLTWNCSIVTWLTVLSGSSRWFFSLECPFMGFWGLLCPPLFPLTSADTPLISLLKSQQDSSQHPAYHIQPYLAGVFLPLEELYGIVPKMTSNWPFCPDSLWESSPLAT